MAEIGSELVDWLGQVGTEKEVRCCWRVCSSIDWGISKDSDEQEEEESLSPINLRLVDPS